MSQVEGLNTEEARADDAQPTDTAPQAKDAHPMETAPKAEDVHPTETAPEAEDRQPSGTIAPSKLERLAATNDQEEVIDVE